MIDTNPKYQVECDYCGKKIAIKDMQMDHIIPKWHNESQQHLDSWAKLGGSRIVKGTDDIDNFNPSCRLCNHYKRASSLDIFRTWNLAGIIGRLRKIYIFRVAEKYGMVEIHEWDQKFYFGKVENENRLPASRNL